MAEPQFPDHVQLADWLLRIERLHPKSWDLGLDRIGTVAERLGVLGQLGRVVIVGGTNGKGTVVHLVESLLMGAGLHVGSTLSPHLVRFEERFRLDGVEARLRASRVEMPARRTAHADATNQCTTDANRQPTGENHQPVIHVTQAGKRRLVGDKFGEFGGCAPHAGGGEGFSGAAVDRVWSGAVRLYQNLRDA